MNSPPSLGIVPSWLTAWWTPLWLLALGAAIGLAVTALALGLLRAAFPRAGRAALDAAREGVMAPLGVMFLVLAVFAPAGFVAVRDSRGMFDSLVRLGQAGASTATYSLPPAEGEADSRGAARVGTLDDGRVVASVPVSFRREELLRLRLVSSDVDLEWSPVPLAEAPLAEIFPIPAGREEHRGYQWTRGAAGASLAVAQAGPVIYVAIPPGRATQFTVAVETEVLYPQTRLVWVTALAVLGFYLAYLAQVGLLPKTSAVALATAKTEMAQPLFAYVAAVGAFALLVFNFLPYSTFGEDIKMFMDSGLSLIVAAGTIVAVFAASNSVAADIEGRTALTVLSKPIARWQYILGKFLGIGWTVAVLFVWLGLVFMAVTAYKPIYDAREMAQGEPLWQECHLEMARTVPGLVLAYMQTLIMTAVSVAVSTRLPMLANFAICSTLFVLGNVTPIIVQSSWGALEPVAFVGTLISVIVPNMLNLNITTAIAGGNPVPYEYLALAFLYSLLYCTIAMLLALTLFDSRDLA